MKYFSIQIQHHFSIFALQQNDREERNLFAYYNLKRQHNYFSMVKVTRVQLTKYKGRHRHRAQHYDERFGVFIRRFKVNVLFSIAML